MKAVVLFAVVVVIVSLASEGEGKCCRTEKYSPGGIFSAKTVCGDCSKGSPYCSRKGKCNMFGCNCDGGCRTGNCDPKQRSRSGRDVIAAGDVDGDGRLSMEEAARHLEMEMPEVTGSRMKRSLWELDEDQDSFLTAEEIDPSD